MTEARSDEPSTNSPTAPAAQNGSRRRSQWTAPATGGAGAAVDPDPAAPAGRRARMRRRTVLAAAAAIVLVSASAVFMAADGANAGRTASTAPPDVANSLLVPLGLPVTSASRSATASGSPQSSPTASGDTAAASASPSGPPAPQQAAIEPSASPAVPGSAPAPRTFRLTGEQSGRCLDVPQSTTAGGTQLDISDCDGDPNQVWTQTGSGQITVYSGNDLMCVDSAFGASTSGAFVIIWQCNSAANQWSLNANGTVTDVRSGLCLDVTQNGTDDGSGVELWTCNGGANQDWYTS